MRTALARSAGEPLKVVWKISHAEAAPARMPPKWINKWGAVQNVSRPILSCQEMSQTPPNEAEVTASAHAQMYQGTVLRWEAVFTCQAIAAIWDMAASGSSMPLYHSCALVSSCFDALLLNRRLARLICPRYRGASSRPATGSKCTGLAPPVRGQTRYRYVLMMPSSAGELAASHGPTPPSPDPA